LRIQVQRGSVPIDGGARRGGRDRKRVMEREEDGER